MNFTWKWNEFHLRMEVLSVYSEGKTRVDSIYGTHVLLHYKNALLEDAKFLLAGSAMVSNQGVATLLGMIVDRHPEMGIVPSDLLRALVKDIKENPEMLDWWDCGACGLRSFLVPNDEPICVWCGEVADVDPRVE